MRTRAALAVLTVIGFLFAGSVVFAQEMEGAALQPAVTLVFTTEVEEDQARGAFETLASTVESAFRSQRRYRLSRAPSDLNVEQQSNPTVLVSVVARRDGALGVESEIWDGSAWVASEMFDLPDDESRLETVQEIAATVTRQVGELFPGFGRIVFTNDGADQPYFVYVDGEFFGTGIQVVELPVGEYVVEIRRRDDGFEQSVGGLDLRLRNDDFVEIKFALDRRPPVIPGYLRLSNPEDRWKAVFDVRAGYLLPAGGVDFFDPEFGLSTLATALLNDVGVRGLVFGVEGGHIYATGQDPLSDLEIELMATPVLANLGLSVGPVSNVDLVVRVGAGMALTRSRIEFADGGGGTNELVGDGYAPVASGTMEFGFGVRDHLRVSLHTAWIGILEGDELFPWLSLGLGIGGRF